MLCPRGCDMTMVDIDDCGDGSRGYECQMCGCVVSVDDEPCPELDNGEPCFGVDNEHGTGQECIYCGRDM